MLEQILLHIHNRFEYAYLEGTFTISSGTLEVEQALSGQYLWIEGSVLNDGLHQYPMTDLEDEEFTGRIVLLAVPKAVLDIADEIAAWIAANGDVLDSPYQSESFGGYSYTKASAGSSDGGSALTGWRAHFADQLSPWRKMSHQGW